MTLIPAISNCGNTSVHNKINSSKYSMVLPSNIDILKKFQNQLVNTPNKELNNNVISFLSCFQEIIVSIYNEQSIYNNLPPLHYSPVDDDAVFIEWIFPFFRIGFSIESKPEDSNWFLVTNKQFQERAESGLFNPLQPFEILNRLINFAISYS